MDKAQKQKLVAEISRKLTDDGKLIEAGWASFKMLCVAEDASRLQIEETRVAFFAGAHHLFASVMSIMDEDREPTEKDLERMSLIAAELQRFGKELEQRAGKSGAS